jgi:hypothetical protein
MRRVGLNTLTKILLGGGLGLLLSIAGCTREDLPSPAGSATDPQAAVLEPASAAHEAVLQPTSKVAREQFQQALSRRFDVARVISRQVSPDGAVLHIPNGRAAHAAVAVRNADGTISRHCVSSSAEVTALMNQTRAGDAP